MKSGMLAAETTFEALKAGDTSAKNLSAYQTKIEQSYIKKELWKVRNFHQGFAHGQFAGFIHTAVQQITGGRGRVESDLPMKNKPHFEEWLLWKSEAKIVISLIQRSLPPHRRLSLRHAPRRGSAVPSPRHGFKCLRNKVRRRVRQSLPVFLPRRRLRNGERRRRPKIKNQFCQLCSLQDLRHRRSLPNHHVGHPRRRRRSQLRGHVSSSATPGWATTTAAFRSAERRSRSATECEKTYLCVSVVRRLFNLASDRKRRSRRHSWVPWYTSSCSRFPACRHKLFHWPQSEP